MTIGINWQPVWKTVWEKVWKQVVPVPPVPPTPGPSHVSGGGGIAVGRRERLPDSWWESEKLAKEIQQQNADDLEVVRILTEFLEELQSHLASAKTNSQQTATHIQGTKGHLETADFKGGRAQKLLNEGVDR